MATMKTITTIKEYDAEGRLVKETTTEYESVDPTWIQPYIGPNPCGTSPLMPWQNPVIC